MLVPTRAETRMTQIFEASRKLDVEGLSNNSEGNQVNQRQKKREEFLAEWRKFRDYLESPLGEELLDEVVASRRDCPVGH